MATNTHLQRLDTAADTTGSSADASNRRQVEDFLYVVPAGSGTHTLAAGSWMQLMTTASTPAKTGTDRMLYADEAANVTNGNPLVIGVLRDEISVTMISGVTQDVRARVIVAGYATGVKTTGGIAADKALVVDTTAGTGSLAAGTDLVSPCGVTIGPEAGGVADVWVLKQF